MKLLAVYGLSNSGKTTLICDLIRRCVARGERVGAIKHTHHDVNARDEGDTRRFREAGADPVILAGNDVAVVFRGAPLSYSDPRELLALFATDVVLIEGFKQFAGWPRVEAGVSPDEALAILDRISAP